MRKSRESVGSAFADLLRSARHKTSTVKTKNRGAWHMSQANFARWLSDASGVQFSTDAYITWENATRLPRKHTREALERFIGH